MKFSNLRNPISPGLKYVKGLDIAIFIPMAIILLLVVGFWQASSNAVHLDRLGKPVGKTETVILALFMYWSMFAVPLFFLSMGISRLILGLTSWFKRD